MSCVAWKAALLPVLLEAALGFGAVDGTATGAEDQASGVSSNAAKDASRSASGNAPSSNSSDISNTVSVDSVSLGAADDTQLVTVPTGTLLRVEVTRRGRLRLGSEVQARLL